MQLSIFQEACMYLGGKIVTQQFCETLDVSVSRWADKHTCMRLKKVPSKAAATIR